MIVGAYLVLSCVRLLCLLRVFCIAIYGHRLFLARIERVSVSSRMVRTCALVKKKKKKNRERERERESCSHGKRKRLRLAIGDSQRTLVSLTIIVCHIFSIFFSFFFFELSYDSGVSDQIL